MTSRNAFRSLLVELFVEELPPKALRRLGEAFAGGLFEQLRAQGLAGADSRLTSFASPRRLAAHVSRVAEAGADRPVSQKLMPVSVGLDAAGNATPALLKKLQALGTDASAVAALERRVDGKAEALFYNSTVQGATLTEGLQKALDETLGHLPIPKVMSYQPGSGCELPGWTSVSFVRPAHGLVALHGADPVPVSVLGLKAGRETHGHRFEATADPIVLADADSYARQLAEVGAVIASFDERRAEIVRQLKAAAAEVGSDANPIEDAALLDEVTALVERPNVLVCQFDPEFLEVPAECLILTMKANQKYFPLLGEGGRLTNRFLVVSNISPDDASAVVQGNERVVRPRLADAKFFFDQDRKKSLRSRFDGLGNIVYHNRLGTLGARVIRVAAIARAVGRAIGGETLESQSADAAMLSKNDLLTDMVGEFPELQGIMGGYYARHDGLSEDIAFAVEDHYKPRFAGDELPRNLTGVAVALADKLETLVGMFGIGAVPTGDRDPFALRRHALGVIRMLIEKDLPLDLDTWIADAAEQFKGIHDFDRARAVEGTQDFVMDRLAGFLRDSGFTALSIDATLARNYGTDAQVAIKPQRVADIPKRLAAVQAFAQLPESQALAAANKRIANILRKSPEAGAQVTEALLREPAEQALCAAMKDVAPRADAQFGAGDYTGSLRTLAALRAPVDAFFDSVLVNAEDLQLRRNRLALLSNLHRTMNRVADLSRLAPAA